MMPIVFEIPFIHRQIPGYGLMLMIGFLLSIMWATRRAARSGGDPDVVLNCGFIALFAGVIGARAMYVIHYWNSFAIQGSPGKIAWAIVDVSGGGLEHYGGLLLALLGVVTYLTWRRHSLRWYLDILAPSAALGLVFGRMGCFLNGCCWGAPCDLPWAVRFPFGSFAQRAHWERKLPGAELPQELLHFSGGVPRPLLRESLAASDEKLAAAEAKTKQALAALANAEDELRRVTDPAVRKSWTQKVNRLRDRADATRRESFDLRAQLAKYNLSADELRQLAAPYRSLPVHPVQLYSVVTAVLLALLLNAVYWRRTRDGQVICALLLVEPATRCVLELIRDDNPLDTAGLTISQFLAICMTLMAVLGFVLLRRMPARSSRARLWEPPEEERTGAKRVAKGAAR